MASTAGLRPSLSIIVLGFVGVAAIASGAIYTAISRTALKDYEAELLSNIVEERAQSTAQLFARGVWAEWQRVLEMAGTESIAEDDATRAKFDFVVRGGDRISWAGFAGLNGKVIVASDGLLIGETGEGRPWFQRGLEGPFAGDVHDAVLLAQKLPRVGNDLPRFLDLAAPFVDDDGKVAGVVGFHLNAAWANQFLEETAQLSGIDAVLVNRDGVVVIGPDALMGQAFPLASFGAARAGAEAAVFEDWPDGRKSLSIVVPSVAYRDLPSFGWSLIARINADELKGAQKAFESRILLATGIAAAVVLLLSLGFISFYILPIGRIARTAEAIADGEDVYPYESRRTSELARLTGAIAKFQGDKEGGHQS